MKHRKKKAVRQRIPYEFRLQTVRDAPRPSEWEVWTLVERRPWGDSRCSYCDVKMIYYTPKVGERADPRIATRDHIKPQARGGRNNLENITVACLSCNTRKGKQLVS